MGKNNRKREKMAFQLRFPNIGLSAGKCLRIRTRYVKGINGIVKRLIDEVKISGFLENN